FEEKLSTRCPGAAVAPARARVVAFLGQCSGHRNNDRVINTLPYSVEVCFATALKLAFDAAVDWITPRHVTGAARFWRDRDAPDLVSELVRYHRMASFVVGDGLASRGGDRLFGVNAHIRTLCSRPRMDQSRQTSGLTRSHCSSLTPPGQEQLPPWLRRTNIWLRVTSPAPGAKRPRSGEVYRQRGAFVPLAKLGNGKIR